VYSPHTAVDAVPGGMADWLCDIVTGAITPSPSSSTEPVPSSSSSSSSSSGSYSRPTYPQPQASSPTTDSSAIIPHTRSTIHPSPAPVPEGFESAGMGRLVTFATPQPLTSLIDRIGAAIGNPAGFPVAVPQSTTVDSMQIRTVGVCPGSGASVLLKGSSNGTPLPDLLFTGEISHHDALAAIERGSAVVALFHSNTERGYLHHVMREKLAQALREEWDAARKEGIAALEESAKAGAQGRLVDGLEEAFRDPEVSVDVSLRDRDPYGIVIRQGK